MEVKRMGISCHFEPSKTPSLGVSVGHWPFRKCHKERSTWSQLGILRDRCEFSRTACFKIFIFLLRFIEIKLEIGHLLRTPGFLCQNARMPIQLIPRWSLFFVEWSGGKSFWWKKTLKNTFLWFRLDCFSAESLSCSAPDQCSSVEERQSCQCLDEHWRKTIWEQCQETAKFQTTLCFGELNEQWKCDPYIFLFGSDSLCL